MAGGSRLITVPSVAPAMACWARRISFWAVAPLRASQSFSMVKAIAAFEPDPEKPKPTMDMLDWIDAREATCRSNALTTSSVRSAVASAGNWKVVMK